jgi:murein biosynthesis integral membrane protein MurJ
VTVDATAETTAEPFGSGSDLATPEGAVGDSLSVAIWTFISRFTGVLRGISVAAVLGATYFANTYQFTNSLPNLIFYGLLAGSLFSSLLVPALVEHVDSGNRRAAARTAGGLLGVALVGMLALVPIVALLTPWLLKLGSVGASDASAAHSQARLGAVLVLLLLPQVPLYAVVGTATAVMNAHRRFALAAAAPALENIGTIVVLGVVAVLYTRSAIEGSIPTSLLLLLGLGTTGAVLCHASTQWWGARRVGVVLVPNAGWRDPQVRATIRRAMPAVVQAALAALQIAALTLVADRVPGGVVAFQLATNFYFLPIALGATPVALSLVPRLSRMTAPSQAGLFRDTYVRGLAFASFLAVPAATAYAVLSRPLAGSIGMGAFGASGGRVLLAAALLGLAPAILGETLFLVTTYACYARGDTSYPLRGMLIHAAICVAGIAVVTQFHGPALLTGLGLSFGAGSYAGAAYLFWHVRRNLPRGGEAVLRPFLRTIVCSALMAAPAWVIARFLAAHLTGAIGRVAVMLVVTLLGASVYFAAQAALQAPQMQWVMGALGGRGRTVGGVRTVWPTDVWQPDGRYVNGAPPWYRRKLQISEALEGVAPFLRRRRIDALVLIGIMGVVALLGYKVKYAIILVIVIGLIGVVWAKPVIAAYLMILLSPLVVGINAGTIIPSLRPNEALMVICGVALGLRYLFGVRTGAFRWPRVDAIDMSLIALCLASSVLPLAMMVVRQRSISGDDLLYSIVLWKLFAEYVIIRTVVTTREQAMRCLWLSLIAASIVSGVGIMQVLHFPGVSGLLAKYYAPLGIDTSLTNGRGSSLLGLPAATADLAIQNLAIAIAMLVRGQPRWRLLTGLAIICALGVVAAAEFSTLIGLVVAIVVALMLTRSRRIAAGVIPVAIIGSVLLWPAISIRLGGFNSATGLPVSWIDRLYNLETYFWPVLFSDNNWILGVEPAARIATSSRQYGYVWIESGYTWLLWGGGIPLLASYFWLVGALIRKGWAYARRVDSAGIAGTAIIVAVSSQLVMMLFDPHLTYRGSGDAFFMTMALVRILPSGRKPDAVQNQPTALDASGPRLQEVSA